MLISIGVDVGGRNGAIAIINTNMEILYLSNAPYYEVENKNKKLKPKLDKKTGMFVDRFSTRAWTDFKELGNIYKPYLKNKIVYTIEKVSVRPNEGEISSFIFGDSLGVHRGMYSYLSPVAYFEPTPQTWKKAMKVTSNKETSIEMAEELFQCNLKDYKTHGKVEDIAEALLLAFYGLMKHVENEGKI